MSISTTSTKESYDGNNSIVTKYPITFKYHEDTHVSVYFDGVLKQRGAGADYVLSGDGTINTGYITTNVAQPATVKVTIVLDVPFDQPVELLETGILSADTLEEAYDRLNMQIRRVWRKAQNVLTFSTDEGGTGSQGTADNLLGFDGSGDLTEIPNTTFAQTANNLSDVDASTARTNLNVDVAGTDNSTDVTLSGTGNQASLVGQALTINKITAGDLNSESATVGQVLQADGDTTCSFVDLVGGGNAQTTNPLSQFASTTSAELASIIPDKTGTGSLVFGTSPALTLENATLDGATVGVVQGVVGALDIRATNEGSIASTTARGGSSVDLQVDRDAGDQVASGTRSAIVGGRRNKAIGFQSFVAAGTSNTTTGNDSFVCGSGNTNASVRGAIIGGIVNKITGTGTNHVVLGGTSNEVSSAQSHSGIFAGNNNTVDGSNSATIGGQRNTLSGVNAVSLGASDGTASATSTLIAGDEATASHNGARVFADSTGTAIASQKADEFCVQTSSMRIVTAEAGAGKVLTCSDADGNSTWAFQDGVGESVTGTATFTNSTNNIALTDIGNLDGLAVGDVIEVNGSVSNDNVYTVETITDANNVIVNAEHAGGTTSKSLTDETAVVTVTLVCKAKYAPLGYGQGWVEVTRSLSVEYNNNTGRTISLNAWGKGTSSGGNMLLFVDGASLVQAQAYGTNAQEFFYGVVPNGSSYESRLGVNFSLTKWSELR